MWPFTKPEPVTEVDENYAEELYCGNSVWPGAGESGSPFVEEEHPGCGEIFPDEMLPPCSFETVNDRNHESDFTKLEILRLAFEIEAKAAVLAVTKLPANITQAKLDAFLEKHRVRAADVLETARELKTFLSE